MTVAAGDVKFFSNDGANLTSLIDDVSVGALTANQWNHISLTGLTLTGARYAGLYIAANAATYNSGTMYIDDVRAYQDSVNLDFSGDLMATAGTREGSLITLKDSGGTIRAYGGLAGSATAGTALLVAGDGSDTSTVQVNSPIEVTSTAVQYDVEGNTNNIVKADTTAAEALSVSVDTGTPTSAGDFRWYDNSDSNAGNNIASLTAIGPVNQTLTCSNTY
jgi:hypothetical protein